MREGYSTVKGIPDPICSIDFAIPAGKAGFWTLGFFSRQYVPAGQLIRVEDMELVLSAEAQERLIGKIIDLKDGRIVTSDFPDTEIQDA